jgi:hypothetical protein
MRRQCVDSRWRETLFILHEIQSGVDLKMGLSFSLANWDFIRQGLREPPRTRMRQHQALNVSIEGFSKFR